jgi:hypothetical protein
MTELKSIKAMLSVWEDYPGPKTQDLDPAYYHSITKSPGLFDQGVIAAIEPPQLCNQSPLE